MRLTRAAIVWWAALWLIYVWFVGKFDLEECATGVLIAAIATAALLGAGGLCAQRYSPRTRWFVVPLLAIVPRNIIRDAAIVLAALVRYLVRREPPRGGLVRLAFDPGDDGDPVSAARRALVVLGITAAPNTIAIGIDRGGREILVHQLVPQPPPSGAGAERWPIG